MKKIPTMYQRDEGKKGHPVVPGIKGECAWVEDLECVEVIATEKIDGQNVKVAVLEDTSSAHTTLLKRRKPADGSEYDEASYVLCNRDDPADKWLFAAFDASFPHGPESLDLPAGIYEAVGHKIQGNPHNLAGHRLVAVDPVAPLLLLPAGSVVTPPRDFFGLKEYLEITPIEGIVFRHPDGRLAKIKRRDFGFPWPLPGAEERPTPIWAQD